MTFYFISFIAIISFAEILYIRPDNENSLKVRTYFNFLNKLVGRGLFLIFLAMIMVQKTDQGEVFFAIGVISVGIIDIILGWDESKPTLPTLPWENFKRTDQSSGVD